MQNHYELNPVCVSLPSSIHSEVAIPLVMEVFTCSSPEPDGPNEVLSSRTELTPPPKKNKVSTRRAK